MPRMAGLSHAEKNWVALSLLVFGSLALIRIAPYFHPKRKQIYGPNGGFKPQGLKPLAAIRANRCG